MKSRPVLFGVLVAVLGVVLQIVYMRRYEEEASGGERVELLVAAEPIERGKQITGDMLGRARKAGVPAPNLRFAYAHLQAYEARRARGGLK